MFMEHIWKLSAANHFLFILRFFLLWKQLKIMCGVAFLMHSAYKRHEYVNCVIQLQEIPKDSVHVPYLIPKAFKMMMDFKLWDAD